MRIGRNEPCWCGSGIKYKHCHLFRKDEKPTPFSVMQKVLKNESTKPICLHPLANDKVCDNIVSIHTIQKSRVLRAIADTNNHVKTFHPIYAVKSESGPFTVGWNRASTITGFCHRHDDDTFAPLEKKPFILSKEQCFLLGYRALCHEVYEKKGSIESCDAYRNIVDRGLSIEQQYEIQENMLLRRLGATKGLHNLLDAKNRLDQSLISGDYSNCSVAAIEFIGQLCIATSGTMTPDVDIKGRQLQELHKDETIEYLSFAIDVTDKGGAIILCWLKDNCKVTKYVEELIFLNKDQLAILLPQLIFFYIENTYFASDWWNSLPITQQTHINILARESNPYYSSESFIDTPLTPWIITRIQTF